ncbi:D-isomer specific 2-hydroxyacid dehydrogenase family protein [Actinocorallia longicatena]
MTVKIAIAPENALAGVGRSTDVDLAALREKVAGAVAEGGGKVVPAAEAEGLVWLLPGGPEPLIELLNDHPAVRWVQLPWAGVEHFAPAFALPPVFTCAKGSFAPQVSEHALMLILACLRDVTRKARTRSWLSINPRSLHGRTVTILGGGGIAGDLVDLLRPFGCRINILRRRPDPIPGTTPITDLHAALPSTDVLVVALSLTPETRHIVGAPELALLPDHAVVVNVARGPHIDTDALVTALRTGGISAAGLDVTDPEPLPADHPLWTCDTALITSHNADSSVYVAEMLCERVTRNVAAFAAGAPLEGVVDPATGY